ncbi:MAG: hypothetical protein JW940_35050 [Polyangiaceae bacterium]|nr:hypothetical protein [Polyangiaceae bacterium]
MKSYSARWPGLSALMAAILVACSSGTGSGDDAGSGGEESDGPAGGSGGTAQSETGGNATAGAGGSTGGTPTGGRSAVGGTGTGAGPGSGGVDASGGQGPAGSSTGGRSETGGTSSTGGRTQVPTGGVSDTGGASNGGSPVTGGRSTGGRSAGGAGGSTGTGGGDTGGMPTGGGSSGGGSSGGAGTGGSGTCEVEDPPASVADWVEASWNAEAGNNISSRSAWLHDSAVKGGGEINLCIRWGATRSATTDVRDKIAPAMERWFNRWFAFLDGYDCFPYSGVKVKITGWAVKPGQESLIEWSDRTVPVYTETESGSDPPNEPKCPDDCGFFFNWDHEFPDCAGGEANHFDYSVWLDDALPGAGAAAVGGDWGIRIPVGTFVNGLDQEDNTVTLHEIGHGFGLQDYYEWGNNPRPEGGSVMIVGTASAPSVGDQWLLRRVWQETRALRYE